MRVGARMAHLYSHTPLRPPLHPTSSLRRITSSPIASSEDFPKTTEECKEFLPWLQQKAGHEISLVLSVGISSFGRSLFASRSIQAGECVLKVPYSSQLTSDKILPEIKSRLSPDVGYVSQLALVLLAEQKLGQNSEWATYINYLPRINEMHSTVFWSNDELEMVRQSPVYDETVNQKVYIEKEYSAVRSVLEQYPQIFGDCVLEDFVHAYTLVESRAWGTSKGVSLVYLYSLIPFADFLNHDGASEAMLLGDEDKEISEVITDRNYTSGEQVLIKYGKFSNATLLLDFGFTLPYNIHDQVQIWIDMPLDDPLYTRKQELLQKHCLPMTMEANGFNSSGSSFIIKEVKSTTGKGKGIPQSLRAFVRVLSTSTSEELKALVAEAAENDGRLARCSLKNWNNEIQAHCILHSRFAQIIQGHAAAIKDLQSASTHTSDRLAHRKQMAIDLLRGELRVLRSACAWLTNYCANLSACHENT